MIALALLLLAAQAEESPTPPPEAAETTHTLEAAVPLSELLGLDFPEGEELARLITAAEAHPLGSKQNPVRASGPGGEHAYLKRLRCEDRSRPAVGRRSSMGIGPFGRMLDGYRLKCGRTESIVHLDMYHDHVESRPAAGFRIVDASRSGD